MNAKQLTLALVVSYIASSTASALVCLLYDPETVGIAPIISLFNVPSILLFIALQTRWLLRYSRNSHLIYVFSTAAVSVVFIYPAIASYEAHDMAMFCLQLYGAGAIAAYFALLGAVRLRKTDGPVAYSTHRE